MGQWIMKDLETADLRIAFPNYIPKSKTQRFLLVALLVNVTLTSAIMPASQPQPISTLSGDRRRYITAAVSPLTSASTQRTSSQRTMLAKDLKSGSHSPMQMIPTYSGVFGEAALANLTVFRRSLLREVLSNAKWGYTKTGHERFDLYSPVVSCPPGARFGGGHVNHSVIYLRRGEVKIASHVS